MLLCVCCQGRTGLLVSAYLLHSGVCPDAQSALDYFASARTNDLQGVTIPSQMRYCHYYEKVLREGPRPTPIYQVTHIRINTVPAVRATGACEPFFKIAFEGRTKIYDYRKYSKKFRRCGTQCARVTTLGSRLTVLLCCYCCCCCDGRYHATDFFMDIDCATHGVYISGDVKFVFYDHKEPSCKKFCHLWINTGYIESTYLHFSRDMVDKACKVRDECQWHGHTHTRNTHAHTVRLIRCLRLLQKKRKFSQNFAIEIFLHRVDAATEAIARKKLHAVATREMSKARRSAATVNVARTAARRGGSRLPAGVTATTGSGGGVGVRGTPGGAPPAAHAAAGAGTGAGVAAAAAAAPSDASVFDDEDMVSDSDSGTDDDDDDDGEGRGGHHMGIAASAPARASAAESLLRMVAPPVVPARRASQRMKPVAGGGSVGSSSPRSNVRASPSPSPTPSPSPSPTPAGQREGHGEGGGDGSSPVPAGDAAGSAVAVPQAGSLPAGGGGGGAMNGVRIKFTPPPPPSIPRGSPPPPSTAPATSNGGTTVPPRLARRRSSARKPLGNWS